MNPATPSTVALPYALPPSALPPSALLPSCRPRRLAQIVTRRERSLGDAAPPAMIVSPLPRSGAHDDVSHPGYFVGAIDGNDGRLLNFMM